MYCDPQALELIARFLLAFILWIWLKNIERLAGWPSIWETSERALAKHCFLVGKVQAVKWQTVRLASWGIWSRLSNAAHLSNSKLVLLCKGKEWV